VKLEQAFLQLNLNWHFMQQLSAIGTAHIRAVLAAVVQHALILEEQHVTAMQIRANIIHEQILLSSFSLRIALIASC
jgi:hypothetical protein